ncbi:Uncharacterised protein [Burkholderia pseudomallei]|nr:Uncharacterised protein [Burkholderia pseudomallei]
MAALPADARHRRAVRVAHAPLLSRRRGQRDSSGDRDAARAAERVRLAAAHAAHPVRQGPDLVARHRRRLHDRPRRADRADRRVADVQPAPLLPALERADRTPARARGRRRRPVRRVQHAARRRRVRDRGTEPQFFGTRERRADHRDHHRRRDRARPERQLHLLRHDRDRPAFSEDARGRRAADRARHGRRGRSVRLAAAEHRPLAAGEAARALPRAADRVRGGLRPRDRRRRRRIRRHDVRQRLCGGARAPRRPRTVVRPVSVPENDLDGRVVPARDSGRDLRAFAIDRRGFRQSAALRVQRHAPADADRARDGRLSRGRHAIADHVVRHRDGDDQRPRARDLVDGHRADRKPRLAPVRAAALRDARRALSEAAATEAGSHGPRAYRHRGGQDARGRRIGARRSARYAARRSRERSEYERARCGRRRRAYRRGRGGARR